MTFPASYSPQVLEAMKELVPSQVRRILDPFAGPEGIRRLRNTLGDYAAGNQPRQWLGIELEPEWAKAGEATFVGDAMALKTDTRVQFFKPEMVITSPPYGNRMADQYMGDAKGSKRYTYAISLGRKLTPGSIAALQWGPKYRSGMWNAYCQIHDVLPAGGWFLLNIANHVRHEETQMVVPQSVDTCVALGFVLEAWRTVTVPKMRHGANGDAREAIEHLFLFRKPQVAE